MKKSTLYAPRLKGDIDLGREPSRVSGPAGDVVKNWSRIDSPGEHIPGRPTQEIGAQSELARYRIGTRRVQDERVFHYCKAEALFGIDKPYFGAQDYNIWNQNNLADTWQGVVDGTVDAGTYQLTITDTVHGLDHFAGGWVFVYSTAWIPQWYRIRSSTNTADEEVGHVTLTLWDPLVYEVANGSKIAVYPSIYGNVRREVNMGSDFATISCVALRVITAGYHFWGQTWGPCVGSPNIEVPIGSYERSLCFNADGSLRLVRAHGAETGSGLYHQPAGHSLFPNPVDTEPNGWFPYMLKLAP